MSLPGHILEGKGCSYCNGGGTKAVICLTTGERFESIAQASKKMGISSSSIVNCCKTPNKHVKGLEFVYDNKRENYRISDEDISIFKGYANIY